MTTLNRLECPRCINCDRPLTMRLGQVFLFKPGQVDPDFGSSNQYKRRIITEDSSRTKADCRKFTHREVASIDKRAADGTVKSFSEWVVDGYGDGFFCKMSCAAKYGVKAAYYATYVRKDDPTEPKSTKRANKRADPVRRAPNVAVSPTRHNIIG